MNTKRYPTPRALFFDVIFSVIILPQMLFLPFGIASKVNENDNVPYLSIYICLTVLFFFVLSLVRLTIVYDNARRKAYMAENSHSFKNDVCFMAKQKSMYVRAGVIAFIYIVLPIKWSFTAISILLPNKFLSLAVLFSILAIITVLANLSAYKHWRKGNEEKYYETKYYNKEIILIAVAYSGGAIAIAVMIPFFPMFSFILKELPIVKIIAVCACVTLAVIVYKYINAYSKRRSCIKRLEKLCFEKGYKLSKINKPYRSLFKFYDEENFNVTVGCKKYSVKFISAIRRNTPFNISSNGDLTFVRTFRIFKVKLFDFTNSYTLTYESSDMKILVLNPTPKYIYKVCEGVALPADNGESIGNYKIYTATAFLRALELDVLDR